MKRSILFLVAVLCLGAGGCSSISFRQPKEFKNRKMKEDPPLLNQAPDSSQKPVLASLPQPVAERI
ncbi:MAG: hypothetical protein V4498_09295 [candidate division FCPU426 bacterium]